MTERAASRKSLKSLLTSQDYNKITLKTSSRRWSYKRVRRICTCQYLTSPSSSLTPVQPSYSRLKLLRLLTSSRSLSQTTTGCPLESSRTLSRSFPKFKLQFPQLQIHKTKSIRQSCRMLPVALFVQIRKVLARTVPVSDLLKAYMERRLTCKLTVNTIRVVQRADNRNHL